jgi:hypothetical protein
LTFEGKNVSKISSLLLCSQKIWTLDMQQEGSGGIKKVFFLLSFISATKWYHTTMHN